jgi:hypothetical protein
LKISTLFARSSYFYACFIGSVKHRKSQSCHFFLSLFHLKTNSVSNTHRERGKEEKETDYMFKISFQEEEEEEWFCYCFTPTDTEAY